MTAITNNSHSFFDYVYTGAVKGLSCGLGLTALGAIPVAIHVPLELVHRAVGFEPKWPMFEGDCNLVQFRGLSLCAQPAISLSNFSIGVVTATTVIGAVIGAVAYPILELDSNG